MMTPSICTIITKNYLSFARTLADSFLLCHPDGHVFVLLVDENAGHIDPAAEKFTLTEVRQLAIPEVESLYEKYSITELITALKPFFLEYLLIHRQLDKIVYLDADILVLNKLKKLYRLLERHSILLTPHTLVPIPDDECHPDEIDLLKTGAYNLGFIGVSHVDESHRFLKWWQARLYKFCYMRTHEGLFVDQKWIDLAPSMFPGTHILHDVSYNVAYWNLHERQITCKNGQYFANQQPLGFYHFSGMHDEDLESISIHQNRYRLSQFPELHNLFTTYQNNLEANGYQKTKLFGFSRPF